MMKALMATQNAIKIVFSAIALMKPELAAAIVLTYSEKSDDQGNATNTTKMPDILSVDMVANIKTKASIDISK